MAPSFRKWLEARIATLGREIYQAEKDSVPKATIDFLKRKKAKYERALVSAKKGFQ